ncbi:MAG TPA: hypothetical protein VKA95_08550, partial [Nitrososphaeraceae archaeon]|nr:hypothetical protein [Nitrososphaeraceae archaeon]
MGNNKDKARLIVRIIIAVIHNDRCNLITFYCILWFIIIVITYFHERPQVNKRIATDVPIIKNVSQPNILDTILLVLS